MFMKTSLTARVGGFGRRSGQVFPAVALVLSLLPTPSSGDGWSARKCALYQSAFDDALTMRGTDGIGDGFLRRNEDFIRSGCTTQGHVCPQTPEEHALADMLTLMTMNEGMASTFVPFGCKPLPDAPGAD